MAIDFIPHSKICTKCGETKAFSFFGKDATRPDGHTYVCKDCRSVAAKRLYPKNAASHRARQKEYAAENPQKVKELRAASRERTKERRAAYNKKWMIENKERKKASSREWRAANPGYSARATAKWRKANPDRARELGAASTAKRRNTPQGKITSAVSSGIRNGILLGSKAGRDTFQLLGYSVEDLKKHLELNFKTGMSWDNYGRTGWHIDHIVPLKAHNFQTPEDHDFKRAWALSNLQPLWASENLSKQAKLARPFQPSLAF
jgi:hypothetical protein